MAKKKDETPAATTKITAVAKQQQGRWRAGLQFSPEGSTYDVTEEQLAAIEDDPLLAIVPNPEPAKPSESA